MKTLVTTLFLLISLQISYAQLTQNISGIVYNEFNEGLIGATIVVEGSNPLIGVSTNEFGKFTLSNVPVGRVELKITSVGYEPKLISNLDLGPSKPIELTVELKPAVYNTKEVEIVAQSDMMAPINEMATASARTFSVEQSQRFAGGRNDISRMASNFAGVRGANDAVNDIVIRGNSPGGLLWRLEGIEIPNPNHFGNVGTTGGPVSMLNNNVLANSDFLTAAFPAEFTNATAGVFDLRMRNGNTTKHSFLGQIGFNGFEFGAEGPINKNKQSSYLVNARYSTLQLMNELGFSAGTGTAVPEYQDFTYKLNFPNTKLGAISLFAVGGNSAINILSSTSSQDENDENLYTGSELDVYDRTRTLVQGLSQTIKTGKKSYLKSVLAFSTIQNKDRVDSISPVDSLPHSFYGNNLNSNKWVLNTTWNYKPTTKLQIKAGAVARVFDMNVKDSVLIEEKYYPMIDYNGSTQLVSPFAQAQYQISASLSATAGLSYQWLALNNQQSVEPRLGLKYQPNRTHLFALAYGLHSQTPALMSLFRSNGVINADGSTTQTFQNQELALVKSHHMVASYQLNFAKNMRLKAEAYYQYLFDVPVMEVSSAYSALNNGSFTQDNPGNLVSEGTGTNYGVEFTLEHLMAKGFYYMVNTSLYKSLYMGSDGVERSTAFDGTYVANVLTGKEFLLSKKEASWQHKLLIDAKVNAAGGQRYSPIDLAASIANAETIFLDSETNSLQLKDYFRADVRVAYRMASKKVTQEWAFDVQNVFNTQNELSKRYDLKTQTTQTVYQMGFYPMFQYRIIF